MNKRGYQDQHDAGSKKRRHNSHNNHSNNSQTRQRDQYSSGSQDRTQQPVDYQKAVEQLPLPTGSKASIPAFTPFTVDKNLPPLPRLTDPRFVNAPFVHKSSVSGYDRTTTVGDLTYERLEFVGDAYIELIATRLVFHHFASLQTGAQSQIRELLVKNETLAEYSRSYGFDKRIAIEGLDTMQAESHGKGNKGLNKVLGDVFEAYVAAVILSDEENGFAIAEKWLTGLWAPKVIEAAKNHHHVDPPLHSQQGGPSVDLKCVYSPTGKADLQRRIMRGDVKLAYEPYRESVELKGNQMGLNKHFIAIYLTGWGYDRQLLGKGEGKNKVEAGNWAAVDAMHGESKAVVDECEAKFTESKERKKRDREVREAEAKEEAKLQAES